MSFDGSTPCWIPDIPITTEREWRLRIAQFGDGYQQRMLDGINALDLRWSLSFENKTSDVLLAMDAYLQEQEASSFPFRDPVSGILYNVFCDAWQLQWGPSRRRDGVTTYYGSLSAEFAKANGVTA